MGVMNVDIVSFPRLAYRVFDELGGIQKTILEDTGKSMVIRRLLSEHKGELEVFASSVGKSGFVGQAKSMLSELFQYSVQSAELSESRKQIGEHTMLGKKLGDIQILYDAFKEYMSDTYMTSEELLDVLARKVPDSGIIRDSIIYIDNFTGFTPSQYSLLEKLLLLCRKVVIGLSIDIHDNPYELGPEYQLFYLTKETLWKLNKMCIRLKVARDRRCSGQGVGTLGSELFRRAFISFSPFSAMAGKAGAYKGLCAWISGGGGAVCRRGNSPDGDGREYVL